MKHRTRFYRDYTDTDGFVFNVKIDTSDLYIKADANLHDTAFEILRTAREELEEHINKHSEFLYSLDPLIPYGDETEISRAMYKASEAAGVGPMAAVAGAIAEKVGRELMNYSGEIIVENGGDIWLKLEKPAIIGIYVNNVYFRNNLGIKIDPVKTPCSVCTSTSRLGHSLSFGRADSVTVIADTGALADAAATAVCNMVQTADDMEKALESGMSIPGVRGCLIIFRDKIALQGDIELAPME